MRRVTKRGYIFKETIAISSNIRYNASEKRAVYNPRNNRSSLGRPLHVRGDSFLAAIRKTAIDNMVVSGLFHSGQVFFVSSDVHHKLMQTCFIHILPDDLFDALYLGSASYHDADTDYYQNPATGTTLFVNRVDSLIVDIQKENCSSCPACVQTPSRCPCETKHWIQKGSGNSGGDGDGKIPDCLPTDFHPGEGWEKDGWEWRGQLPKGGDKGGWFNPETGESYHPNFDHGPPDGPHWDYNTRTRPKIKIPVCTEGDQYGT